MTMTSKERIDRILKHQPVDRIGLFEVFWTETVKKWSFEKAEMIEDLFGTDLRRSSGGCAGKLLKLVANFEAKEELVEETDKTRLVRNGDGALLRWLKEGHSGGPEHVDFLVKDRSGWEKHIRPYLLDKTKYERRIDFQGYRRTRSKSLNEKRFFCAAVMGPFESIAYVCGHEHLLVGMGLDPDWICEMRDIYMEATIEMLENLFHREGLPDGLWVWDDVGFKTGPFMSPSMYRELIFPGHKRLFDWAHDKKLPTILHTDGFIESLIPHFIEAGMDCLQPLEVKSGMDPVRIKKMFGEKIALIGGMDARVLESNDLHAVRLELENKIPALMNGSGYILQVDHSVSDKVDYETYKFFVEKGLGIGTYQL